MPRSVLMTLGVSDGSHSRNTLGEPTGMDDLLILQCSASERPTFQSMQHRRLAR